MIKDVTKAVLAQSEEFGRKINLNITRLDIYCNKVKNIYRLLGAKDLLIKILENGEFMEGYYDNRYKALQLAVSYGRDYFLDIYYTNTRDTILLCLGERVPRPEDGNAPDEMKLAG